MTSLSLEQQVQELKEQVSQSQTQSNADSLKQYTDLDLHPVLNSTIDDPDFNMVVHQASLLDPTTPTTSSSISSRISSPTHIPSITPNCTPHSRSHWSDLAQHF